MGRCSLSDVFGHGTASVPSCCLPGHPLHILHTHSTALQYKAVNGGLEVKRGSALGLLNPLGAAWSRIRAASKVVKSHNLVGEGMIMGGLLVVAPGGQPQLVHLESDLGVTCEHSDVVRAVERAAAPAATGGVTAVVAA